MHTNWCVFIEISMETGILNFWLGLLVTALTKETYFSQFVVKLLVKFVVKFVDKCVVKFVDKCVVKFVVKSVVNFVVNFVNKLRSFFGRSDLNIKDTTFEIFWPLTGARVIISPAPRGNMRAWATISRTEVFPELWSPTTTTLGRWSAVLYVES